MTPSLHQNLKDATQHLHQQIDQTRLMKTLADSNLNADDYRRVLSIQFAFFSQFEPYLTVNAPWRTLSLNPFERQKLRYLNGDCAYFDFAPKALYGDSPAFSLERNLPTSEHCVGATYVIEGSTLGAQFLMMNLKKTLRIAPSSGSSFYHGYGDRTAARWRDFLKALEAYGTRRNHEKILQGAIFTFESFLKIIQ